MAVPPSADNGNVSVETEPTTPAPSEAAPEADPAPVTPDPATPAEPVVELFELPDGRKVDAATLSKEWKENFLPEFTRKSQALAAKENQNITPPKNPLEDPEYVPQSYAELAGKIKADTLKEIEERNAARDKQQKDLEDHVSSQLTEIKKTDPALNENALFVHATKYGFRDLIAAHRNMKDMAETVKKVQTKTAQDIAKRSDPVSATPGASGSRPEPSNFSTSQEYLRALKASGAK